jgi:CHRD domain
MTFLGRWTRNAGLGLALAVASSAAHGQSWAATLNGGNEAPPNASAGTGSATFTLLGNFLTISGTFTGLTGTTTVAHIHCCTAVPLTGTAGVATVPSLPFFPVGVTSGTFSVILDLTLASSYNTAFVTANGGTPTSAQAAMVAGMNNGRA